MAKHLEDLRLVERMLAGEQPAFEAFGERCFRVVYRYMLAQLKGDRELAMEIVQAAMAKALAKLDSYRGEASLPTWLCSCCRNEMLMHFRRQRSAPIEVELQEESENAAGFSAPPPADAQTELLSRESSHLVHLALDLVPQHYAQALEWMYIERLPVKEIAARLSLHPKAAESLLTRARQAFRTSYAHVQGRS